MSLRLSADTNACPHPRTILLVEDELFVRQATCSILQSVGFTVLPAEDAQTAIETYESFPNPIDLVMTDLVLPGKSGLELTQQLRQHSPRLAVLLTSGYSDPICETPVCEHTVCETPAGEIAAPESRTYFLAKPYSKRTLVEKIENILGADAMRDLAHRRPPIRSS